MTGEFRMTQDIVEEHKMRMLHIRKYYPFFKIMETSFVQYKEGKYAGLDMGYITLAILRFFMEENNFKNKEVTYTEYVDFMEKLLRRDFRLELEKEEGRELIGFIFDKIKNDGKPFLFPYYDPTTYKKMVMRVKLLDSRMEEQTVYYSITAEAIEFYLDTKEFKDQSTITIEQLLLEKMIRSRNFRGGTEVVKRINSQVSRLQAKKNEVLGILSFDVFQGMKAYEEFMETGTKWFEEEQRLFQKNSQLIRFALEKAEADQKRGEYQSQYYKAMEEIYTLEQEMKKAIVRHGELLQACMDLQKKADELVSHSKLHALRPTFDFHKMVQSLMEQERADKLEYFVEPLLKLNIRKTFQLRMIDEMLTYRPEKEEAAEVVVKKQEEDYIYEDEIEDNRIAHNFQIITKILLDMLLEKKEFTLEEFCENQAVAALGREIQSDMAGSEISNGMEEQESTGGAAGLQNSLLWNGDFYTFLIHLSQKKEYNMEEVRRTPDTFLEESLCSFLQKDENARYRQMHITLEMLPDKAISCGEAVSITNIRVRLE